MIEVFEDEPFSLKWHYFSKKDSLISEIKLNPYIHLHTYEHLMFYKEARNTHWKNDSIFDKWFWSNWIATCRRIQIDPYLLFCRKLKSIWIKNFNIRLERLNLTEEKVEHGLECIGTGKDFQNRTVSTQKLRLTIHRTSWNWKVSVWQRTPSFLKRGSPQNRKHFINNSFDRMLWNKIIYIETWVQI